MFPDHAAARAWVDDITNLAQATAIAVEDDGDRPGPVVVRVSETLDPEQAADGRRALDTG